MSMHRFAQNVALCAYLIEILRKFLPARLQSHQNQTIRMAERREFRGRYFRLGPKTRFVSPIPFKSNAKSETPPDHPQKWDCDSELAIESERCKSDWRIENGGTRTRSWSSRKRASPSSLWLVSLRDENSMLPAGWLLFLGFDSGSLYLLFSRMVTITSAQNATPLCWRQTLIGFNIDLSLKCDSEIFCQGAV